MMMLLDELRKEADGFSDRVAERERIRSEEKKAALLKTIESLKGFYNQKYIEGMMRNMATNGRHEVTINLYHHDIGETAPDWYPNVHDHIEHVLHEMNIPETNYEFGTRNEEGIFPVQIIGYIRIWW